MQTKVSLLTSVGLCLSMYFTTIAASSSIFPMNLWQTSSCTVDGERTSDVDMMNGQPKTVVCTWGTDDAGMQVILHVGQLSRVMASCQFTPAKNSEDVISDIQGAGAALIKHRHLNTNLITFIVKNNRSSKDLVVQFPLNGSEFQYYDDGTLSHYYNAREYSAGDTITCKFSPMRPMSSVGPVTPPEAPAN